LILTSKFASACCFCVILYTDPDVNGKYLVRCREHTNSRTTKDVFTYCADHRPDPAELDTFVDVNGKTQIRLTEAGRTRRTNTKESTRP